MSVQLHILNAIGNLDTILDKINPAYLEAKKRATELLNIDKVDIVIRNSPNFAIPGLGVGGYTDSLGSVIYVSVDDGTPIKEVSLVMCLDHELYHLARHRLYGVPTTLADRIIDEGLACLYEYETSKIKPLYARQKISNTTVDLFREHAHDTTDNDRWFFGQDKLIPQWFGYSYGFDIALRYKQETGLASWQMLDADLRNVLLSM